MKISYSDVQKLIMGSPPSNGELLNSITVGRGCWLDRFQRHYLENFIAEGGSKVKVLVGNKGSGKTHLILSVLSDAREMNYATAYISARSYKLNDLAGLYRSIVQQINIDELIGRLCCQVAKKFDIDLDEYDGSGNFIHLLYEQYPPDMAKKEIQKNAIKLTKNADFNASFKAFVFQVIRHRMISGSKENIDLALKWLSGEKLDTKERKALFLFDRLQKNNARDWLNSLIQLLRLSGKKGLIVAIDDLEVMTEKSIESGRFLYTKNAINDTCELFRQLIDDTEVLSNCLFLLGGNRSIIDDYNRGFKSYDALWIRLQTGLTDSLKFNALADLVDVDKHLNTLHSQNHAFFSEVYKRVKSVILESEIEPLEKPFTVNQNQDFSDLQKVVIEAVFNKEGLTK